MHYNGLFWKYIHFKKPKTYIKERKNPSKTKLWFNGTKNIVTVTLNYVLMYCNKSTCSLLLSTPDVSIQANYGICSYSNVNHSAVYLLCKVSLNSQHRGLAFQHMSGPFVHLHWFETASSRAWSTVNFNSKNQLCEMQSSCWDPVLLLICCQLWVIRAWQPIYFTGSWSILVSSG